MIDFPNYDNNVLRVIASIKKHYGEVPSYESLQVIDNIYDTQDIKHTIIILLDGLGTDILNYHLSADSFLRRNMALSIQTVFPPTTCAATTAIVSGSSPLHTGWLGWTCYFKEVGTAVELFRDHDHYDKVEINKGFVNDILGYEPFFSKYRNARKYFPAFDPNGFASFEELLEKKLEDLHNDDESFSYIYWDEPDATMHEIGTRKVAVTRLIQSLDESIERFACRVPSGTLIITLADHGHIDVEPIFLDQHPIFLKTLSRLPSVEPRAQSFKVKEKMIFKEYFKTHFGEFFTLYKKNEAIKLFGNERETPHPRLGEFIGDYIAVAKSNKYFVYDSKNYFDFKAHHAGGLTTEMQIPVIIFFK